MTARQFLDFRSAGGGRPNEIRVAWPILVVVKMLLLGTSVSVVAQQDGNRVFQRDAIGHIEYHKQSWVIQDGKLCQTDTLGNIQHHKLCLEIGSLELEKATKADK